MTSHGSVGGLQLEGLDAIDARAFRDTVGAFVTGVTVVTTALDDELYGMTVSAFTSLSLDPLLVLISLDNDSRGRGLLERSGIFSVSILADDQAALSRLFANRDRPRGLGAFDGVPISWGATGAPVLRGCAAHVDARIWRMYDGGDHTLVIGEVHGLGSRPEASPLLFHRGRYRLLGGAETTAAVAHVSTRRMHALPGVPQGNAARGNSAPDATQPGGHHVPSFAPVPAGDRGRP